VQEEVALRKRMSVTVSTSDDDMTRRHADFPPLVMLAGEDATEQTRIVHLVASGAVVVLAEDADRLRSWWPKASCPHEDPSNVRDVRIGQLEILPSRQLARWRGTAIPLTRLEFRILETLMQEPERVWRFMELQETAWSQPYYGDGSHVRSAIKRLRRKLARAQVDMEIQSVRGVGFRLRGP
jgi:two-component system response regulator MtrA